MYWKSLKYFISVYGLALFILLGGCLQSDYTRMVKAELKRGVRYDSLLLGIKMGDTRNEFFGRCFDLNKQQLISQGPGNSTVKYIFTDSLLHNEPTELMLLFYPTFDDSEIIIGMDMEFSYTSWAPWNANYQSDSLEVKLKDLLKMWYPGNDFVMANINGIEVPVKVDGNRRILMSKKDTQNVVVSIQDILHPRFMHSISKK